MKVKGKQIQLPNAIKNRAYSFRFNIRDIELPDVTEFNFEDMPEGISYSEDDGSISGTPIVSGDYNIILKCINKDGHKAQKEILLTINPDPKELWGKNIPTPEDIEYYKPDSDKLFVKGETKIESKYWGLKKMEIPRRDMIAASQRGRSHAIDGKPRDDDFVIHFDEKTEWYIMAVADGAGSADYSRKGSQIACNTAKEVCGMLLTEGILDSAISEYFKDNSEKNRSCLYNTLVCVGKKSKQISRTTRKRRLV